MQRLAPLDLPRLGYSHGRRARLNRHPLGYCLRLGHYRWRRVRLSRRPHRPLKKGSRLLSRCPQLEPRRRSQSLAETPVEGMQEPVGRHERRHALLLSHLMVLG